MKLKLLVLFIEKLLKIPEHGDEPRADMYLPIWLLAFGLVLGAAAIALTVAFIIILQIALIVIAAICAILSVAAVLCWRNQTLRIIDDETFEYSTFLGNKSIHKFSDISGLRRNSDSLTLFVKNKKIHIESIAIVSERLDEKIFNALEIL